METQKMPDAELLHSIFSYDPREGVLVRKLKRGNLTKVVGARKTTGYRYVYICQKQYLVSRIIWKMITDMDPIFIDHKDGNPLNNRWDNLREVTKSQNGMNRGLQRNNPFGATGVGFDKARNKWIAGVKVNGKRLNLGRYKTFEEARNVRDKKAKELFGDFYHHCNADI